MDYRIIIAIVAFVLLFGDTEGALATRIASPPLPGMHKPSTSPVPTTTTTTKRTTSTTPTTTTTTKRTTSTTPTTTTTTKRTTSTTRTTSTMSTTLSPTSTNTMAPITCFSGTCTTLPCSNSSFPIAFVKCTTPIPACVTEITAPKGGDKQYLFRCATSICSVEKKNAINSTEVMCCNQSKCNTYEAALGSCAPCWTGITTLIALGLEAFRQLYVF